MYIYVGGAKRSLALSLGAETAVLLGEFFPEVSVKAHCDVERKDFGQI